LEFVLKDRSFKIYLLAVCFVSVVCVTITAGIGLYSLVKIMAPQLTLDTHSYNAHQSLDNFKQSHFYANRFHPRGFIVRGATGVDRALPMRQSDILQNRAPAAEPTPLTDEEVEQLRLESYQMLIRNHKRSAIQELIRATLVLFISSMLFLAHWRLIRKYDNEAD
jgi:hypothetical protein